MTDMRKKLIGLQNTLLKFAMDNMGECGLDGFGNRDYYIFGVVKGQLGALNRILDILDNCPDEDEIELVDYEDELGEGDGELFLVDDGKKYAMRSGVLVEVLEDESKPLKRKTEGLCFGKMLDYLKEGWRCSREGWNGKNMYIEIQVPDVHSKMSLPYIYMRTAQGDLVPWLASQTDILSDDWERRLHINQE